MNALGEFLLVATPIGVVVWIIWVMLVGQW